MATCTLQPEPNTMRTLLIFIALALFVMIGRQLLLKPRSTRRRRSMTGKMVPCASCGIYIPENEAFERDGRLYCSREHRDAAHDRS